MIPSGFSGQRSARLIALCVSIEIGEHPQAFLLWTGASQALLTDQRGSSRAGNAGEKWRGPEMDEPGILTHLWGEKESLRAGDGRTFES